MKNSQKHWIYALICLAVLLSLALPRGATAAPTNVSGIISTDTTWTLANSPYIVTGNVLVNSGVTLTIEPGVTVKFNSGKAIQIDGTLIARGTSNNMITFTSNEATPAAGDWGYIYFSDTNTDASYDADGNYTGGSILEYCVVEYAGGLGSGAVKTYNAHPFINFCTIQNNMASGIYADNLSATLKITNNNISYNSDGGIDAFGQNTTATINISKNTISNNTAQGGSGGVSAYGTVNISDNIISSNVSVGSDYGSGGMMVGGIVSVTNNTITNNSSLALRCAGGIYAYGAGTIDNNVISYNICYYEGSDGSGNRILTYESGGGIYLYASYYWISNNTISHNSATSSGGILFSTAVESGTVYIYYNSLLNNDSSRTGGAGGIKRSIESYEETVTISGNIVNNNSGDRGIDVWNATITENIINNNNGGGVKVSGGTLSNNIISSNNNTTDTGGGIYALEKSGVGAVIANNFISENSAPANSAIYLYGNHDFRYNTVTGNKATDTAAYTIYIESNPLVNYNNIFTNTAANELYNGNAKGYTNVDATNNWWGTSTESEIQGKIYDFYDDVLNNGIVNYSPYLILPDTTAPISPPTSLTATAGAGQITLYWSANPESDTAGYKIYWGTTTGFPYANSADAGNATSYTITGLTDGTYYVTVTSYDTNYNPSNDTSYTIVNDNQTNGNESWYAEEKTVAVDASAPTGSISINSGAASTNSTPATLTLSCTDTNGCAEMQFSNDNSTWSTAEAYGTSKTWTLSSGDGTKTVYVKFKDVAGNWSTAYSDMIALDTAAPDTSITSQPSNPTNSTTASFTFTSTETGSTFECQMVTGGYSTCTSPKSYTGLTEGSHTFYVETTDSAGNTDATPASYTWTIDSTAPIVSAGGNKTTNVSFTQTATATDANAMTYSWTKQTGTGTIVFGSPNALPTTVSASSDGIYTLRFTATDAAGNSAYSDMTLVWDTVAPDTTITAQPSNPTNSITASFSFTSTEASSTFECQMDSGGYSSCTSPKAYTGLTDGSHTFYVKATDTAGNTDTTPASYTWTIDTTAPTVTINAVTTPTSSTSQTITGTVETGATVNVATNTAASDGAAIVTGTTWSYTITGLAAGANNITVTATDTAGNTANASSAITLDTTTPVFSSTSPSSDSVINTATVGYLLSEAVASGSITFTRIGGTADSSAHVYNFTSSDMTAGTHSVNTGLSLVSGAIYTVTFEATDAAGNTGSVSSTNVTYDTSSASVTIISPAANSVTNNAKVSYTLSEGISVGDIVFTGTGGASDSMSPYTYTLSASERTAGSHTVDAGKTLMDGTIYTVSFENIKDMAGNPSSNISNTNITYDSTAVAITNTTPAASSIITNATVSYTLSEDASAGTITFTWTGGNADGSSSHVYNFTSSDLTSGSHTVNTNLTLVDGAFYTVSFDATGLVGNAATTVSNAMVYYDSNYGIGPVGNVDNISYSSKRVDGYDLIKLSIAFGSAPGDANWNPVCDMDGNSKVDGSDLIVLGNHFGEVQ